MVEKILQEEVQHSHQEMVRETFLMLVAKNSKVPLLLVVNLQVQQNFHGWMQVLAMGRIQLKYELLVQVVKNWLWKPPRQISRLQLHHHCHLQKY